MMRANETFALHRNNVRTPRVADFRLRRTVEITRVTKRKAVKRQQFCVVRPTGYEMCRA
jgi:hypothetical protein